MLLSTSQTSVEQKLDKLINDIQQGRRAPSVVSIQTVDSLDPDDKEAWRTIRKELEDIGISVAAFEANKDFIFEKIYSAVNAEEFEEQAVSDTGEFQEQALSSPLGSMHALDGLSLTSSSSSLGAQERNQTAISDAEPPKASRATTKPTRHLTSIQAEQARAGTSMAAEPHSRVIPLRVSRVAALITTLTRFKKRLTNAVEEDDVDRIKKLLANPSPLIDRPALNTALQSVTSASSKEAYALLIDAGADVNQGYGSSRPLTKAVLSGRQDLVALLLDKGAYVNYQDSHGGIHSSALRAAIAEENAAMITFLSQKGADVNAVQPTSESGIDYRGLGEYPTGIHQASVQGITSIVDLLINLGANFTDSQGVYGTPLSLAIYGGYLSIVQLLINKGADVNEVPLLYQRQTFRSNIHIAIYCHLPDMVELLLKSGAVTDWHEAYLWAAKAYERTLNISPLDNPRDMRIRAGRERTTGESIAVMKLIKEQKGQKRVIRY